ncbi:C1q-related factor-like [Crassostrea virginica]
MKINVRFGLIISAKDTPVGFTAGMTTGSTTWEGDNLVFPYVITNKGQGYSLNSGKFTAPRDGTYVFTVTAVSWSSNFLSLDIVHDGVSKVRTYSYSYTYHQTGTNLVVLELDRGDAVWVTRHYGRGYYSDSVPLTTFSGFIL